MEALGKPALSRGGLAVSTVGWPGLALAIGILAYRPLFAGVLQLPTPASMEDWLFRPSALPAPLVLGASAWLVWRRRGRLTALRTDAAPWSGALLAALGGACFVWSLLTGAVELLLVSLSAHLLAFAVAARGRAGCRALCLPALVLLLGVRIPAPLLEEVVWTLQLWSATASSWLLAAIGREFVHAGVILGNGEHVFQVIDGCSGFQGIAMLALVAILVREVFAHSGVRLWLLLALAPGLGFVLNLLRIAVIAASPEPRALFGPSGDHGVQGIVVVAAGTGILYATGWWMARSAAPSADARGATRPERQAPWAPATAQLSVLLLISLLVTPFDSRRSPSVVDSVHFPVHRLQWTSTPLVVHPMFMGVLPAADRLHRRFQLQGDSPQVVELFVGRETARFPHSSQLLSSKLRRPGPEWGLIRSATEHQSALGRDVEVSVASRPWDGGRALVYSWRLRDGGLWRESWRSLFALESSPLARERPRTVVRILTHGSEGPEDGPGALDLARRRLDRFVETFRDDLAAL